MVQRAADARKRFAESALSLFRERGYAATTVPQIAERAGLTERTFYRYFTDKQEVLFCRAVEFQATMTEAINRTSAATEPFDAVRLPSSSGTATSSSTASRITCTMSFQG